MSTIAETKIENVNLENIFPSSTNPRKNFEEKALNELSESIKEHGLLQPILVRPIPDSEDKDGRQNYEIVYGERRYRASKLAGLKTIKAEVRWMSDEEAFEIQIIENLERKDVHPLDEADAFKKMLDSGKYTTFDIAMKMAKPESFIVQRLKLVDLIEEVRKDFIDGYLGVGHAMLIAKCDAEKQLGIHSDAQPWSGGKNHPDYGTIPDLKEAITDDTNDLSDALFDLDDAELVKGCVACSICPKRSKANPLLFEDIQEDVCFDEICFDSKLQAFTEKEVAKIINEGLDIHLVGYGKTTDFIFNMCKEFNVPILKQYDDYSSYSFEGGTKVRAFCIAGNSKGKFDDIWLKPKDGTNTSASSGESFSNEEMEIKEQIAKIEARADRSKELDGEKVWVKIREIDTSEIKTICGGLFEVEVDAVCLAMISKLGYYGNQEVRKLVGEFTLKTLEERNFTKFEYNQIQRIFFLECLPVAFGDYYSNVNNYAYTKALSHYEGEQIQKFIDEQKAISDVRMDKADAKIKALKDKLKVQKPVEEIEVVEEDTPPEPVKKSTKNKGKTKKTDNLC